MATFSCIARWCAKILTAWRVTSLGWHFISKGFCTPPADRVFAACVEPDQLSQWWGPAGFSIPSVELDVRAGGRYRITMQPPEGEVFHLRGQFSEVDPRRRLVYTFEWEEPDPDDQETLVSLSFIDGGERTELLVDQGPFATQARYELHEAGWTETLDRLAAYLA